MKNFNTDYFGKVYDLMLYWCITSTCNFSCPYCIAGASKIEEEYAPEVVNIKALEKFLDNTDKIIRFGFTGGEPFLVRNIIEILQLVTKKHYFSMTTNLVSPKIMEMVQKIDSKKSTFIKASAHISELKRHQLLETYMSNCKLVKERGFNIENVEVAYPFIIDKVDEYRKIFKDRGLELNFMPFTGEWNSKKYPDSYTFEEIDIFGLTKEKHLRYDIFNQKGKLCTAGYNTAVIMEDGNIFPCFQIHKKLGSIEENLHMLNGLIRCPFDTCACPMNIFEPFLYKKALEEFNIHETESTYQIIDN